jgi:hypothetical protein
MDVGQMGFVTAGGHYDSSNPARALVLTNVCVIVDLTTFARLAYKKLA